MNLIMKSIFQFASKKKKKLISLGQATVLINQNQLSQEINKKNNTQYKSLIEKEIQQITVANINQLSFQKLCQLEIPIRQKIRYDIMKYKFNTTNQQLKQASILASYSSQSFLQLNQYYRNLYSLLTNQLGIQHNQDIKKSGYLGQMEHTNPMQDQNLILIVKKFILNITKPSKLENIAQPTFIKYLLALKRDFTVRGVELKPISQNSQIKILKIIQYQHEFWVDVHHNRSKNGKIDDFVIQQKIITNPNESILVNQEHPKILVKYITRKKKTKNYEMCFCSKCELLISINQHEHIIKIQWKGPSQKKGKQKVSQSQFRTYKIIDFDKIYKGNPTIKPIFDF